MNDTMKRAAVTAVAAVAVLLGSAGAASAAEAHDGPGRAGTHGSYAKQVVHGPGGAYDKDRKHAKRVHVKDRPGRHAHHGKRVGARGPVKKVVVTDGRRAPRR